MEVIHQIIMFIVMVIVGMLFNPMNILAYKLDHLYLSLTLFYGGLLMAANMMWAHEIIHYLYMGNFNVIIFVIGIILSSIISIYLLRQQLFVNDSEWLKRMISHHSTALTTSKLIYNRTSDPKIKKISKEIIIQQMNEIELMKTYLKV
jgi:hypothetical protein